MNHKQNGGFTLVEVMVGLLILMTLFGSMALAYLGVKSLNMMARHKMQAMHVVRGQLENLKAMPFANIADAASVVAYDAGPDGTYGTADDMSGTLTTSVQDAVDFDGDGNTVETQINVDNQGGNDAVALPVRVSFAWSEWVVGQARNMTVTADTVIAQ